MSPWQSSRDGIHPPPPPCEAQHRGRKPQGERALTGAERQARYRQRQADNRAAPARHPAWPMRYPPAAAMACRCRHTAPASGRVCSLLRCAARGAARRRHRRGAAGDCRSRSRRTGQHRAAARLWAGLTVGCQTGTAARPRGPTGTPYGLRGRPAPPVPFQQSTTSQGVNSSGRRGVNSGCRLTGTFFRDVAGPGTGGCGGSGDPFG